MKQFLIHLKDCDLDFYPSLKVFIFSLCMFFYILLSSMKGVIEFEAKPKVIVIVLFKLLFFPRNSQKLGSMFSLFFFYILVQQSIWKRIQQVY